MTNCARCFRPLTDPLSITRGYGPDCWGTTKRELRAKADQDKAARSDYTWHINNDHGKPVLAIADLDRGRMSVTNNIEAIVRAIAGQAGGLIYLRPIVYRDSSGCWDGVDGRSVAVGNRDVFYPINAPDEDEAVKMAIKREEWQK